MLLELLTALSGPLGLVIVAYLAFLVVYGVWSSSPRTDLRSRDAVMTVLMSSCAVLAFGALGLVVVFTIARGWAALVHLNFYTQDMSRPDRSHRSRWAAWGTPWSGPCGRSASPSSSPSPCGLVAAIYLDETRGRSQLRPDRRQGDDRPSLHPGRLFIYAAWILALGIQRSGLAAALALSVMMLPYIIRTADLVLRLVPANLREAAAALGARAGAPCGTWCSPRPGPVWPPR